MLCALSGQTPKDPVVSVKSGHLYEKSLVTKYIEINGKDPITDEELTIEDLISIKKASAPAVPRPATATSIPQLLQTLQNEWDATMLETFQLKKHLDTARKELSQALYQHDAACRVIARLIKERDQAREALSNAQAGRVPAAANSNSDKASQPVSGLPEKVASALQTTAKTLSKSRKKRQISRSLATNEAISNYESSQGHQWHSDPSGVQCVAVHPKDDTLIVTGGNDGNAVVYNRNTNQVAATLAGHTARINSVQFTAEGVVLTASADRTARVWQRNKKGEFNEAARLPGHSDEITAITLHPSNNYAATGGRDGRWALHDVVKTHDAPLQTVDSGAPLSVVQFHVDGLLLATGDSLGSVGLYDVLSKQRALSFDAHQGGVSAIAFSENGYNLVTSGSADSSVKLWDLRKQLCVHTLRLEKGYGVKALQFDHSGSYVAVAGADVRVFAGKTLTHVKTFTDHAAAVTGVAFGDDAKWLVSTSADHTVRFWQ